MKMKMSQLPYGVMAMGLPVVRWCRLIVTERCKKINILLVLSLCLEMHSGDQEGYEWKIDGSAKMNGGEDQCMPPSQALRHSKLMRPDKHF